jgi:hypothetical protein
MISLHNLEQPNDDLWLQYLVIGARVNVVVDHIEQLANDGWVRTEDKSFEHEHKELFVLRIDCNVICCACHVCQVLIGAEERLKVRSSFFSYLVSWLLR